MKTSLSFLSLFFAAAVPAVLIVESLGLSLPAGLNALSALVAFSMTFLMLIVAGDYARRSRSSALVAVPEGKAAHPLAA